MGKRVLAGGIAGGSSIIIVNPTDVVKTQMQTATGQPQIMKIARNVWKGEGIAGFWKGVNPNVARCFIGNACEIGFYDTTKCFGRFPTSCVMSRCEGPSWASILDACVA